MRSKRVVHEIAERDARQTTGTCQAQYFFDGLRRVCSKQKCEPAWLPPSKRNRLRFARSRAGDGEAGSVSSVEPCR